MELEASTPPQDPQTQSPPQADPLPAKDSVVNLQSRMRTKQQIKQAKEREARRQALRKAGAPEEVIEKMLDQEDYERLPIDQKVNRLESMLVGMSRGVGEDVRALQHNDGQIADAFDVNLRAVAKMFEKLGITRAEQLEFIKASAIELKAEAEARQEADRKKSVDEFKKAAAANEQQTAEQELKKAESPSLTEEKLVRAEIPEGATTF